MSQATSTPTPPKSRSTARRIRLNQPKHFFNRELSWLEFNARVLEEAEDQANPLLERVKFLSIFASNLDEYFMIRVSGLRSQRQAGVVERPPDGMTPAQQLAAIRKQLKPLLDRCSRCWTQDLLPKLKREGINVLDYNDLKGRQQKLLRRHLKTEIFPILTPLAFDPGHPFPHISNLSVNLAVVVRDPVQGERFARLKVPQTLPRLIRVPDEETAESYENLGLEEIKEFNFVWLEEVVAANLDLLFPGHEVVASYPFRVTRDADLEIEEDEASDLLTAMAEVVGQRHFGSVVRLEIDLSMPDRIRDILMQNLELAPYQVYTNDCSLGMTNLMELAGIDRSDLKDPPYHPVVHPVRGPEESLFSVIRRRDVLLFHPYDSFAPVVQFLTDAARDPDVLAIKQTLYRVGPNSPIVEALMEARQNGKQVSALVELKARFDEENNIVWARALEEAGVHVVYGLLGLKTHAKMSLVVRREKGRLRRYVHLATGNYNPVTARIYTDLGYWTCNPAIGKDVSDLFNGLTGYSRKEEYRRLLVAPGKMRQGILDRIAREVERHTQEGGGHIVFKMNALVDRASILALYKASQAGVKIDLQVRGICCLRPGVPRVSENITVTSIVGRFLEHSRIYYFRNGGEEEILMGSADLMPRNLDGRVEVLFPIDDPDLLPIIRDEILFLHLRDTVRTRRLGADGAYTRAETPKGADRLDVQEQLLGHPGSWRLDD